MRLFALGFVCAAFLFAGAPLIAESIVRIVPGQGGDLSARVLLLERAVAQLQYSDTVPAVSEVPSGLVSCTLKTPFDGTFRSSGAAESTARTAAVTACKAAAKGSLYCEEKGVVCEKK